MLRALDVYLEACCADCACPRNAARVWRDLSRRRPAAGGAAEEEERAPGRKDQARVSEMRRERRGEGC